MTSAPAASTGASARRSTIELSGDAPGVLRVGGSLRFAEASAIWTDLEACIARCATTAPVVFDLSQAESIDGSSMALLVHARDQLIERGVPASFEGPNENVKAVMELYEGDRAHLPRRRKVEEGLVSQVGRATFELFGEIQLALGFFGQMLLAAVGLLKEPRTGNWKAVWPTMERAGADAVPIVILINFLVGFVMGFQGAAQLKQFGANLYVADLVGLSITRELGPLMTAIILCGRSGAAFAAQLGSMRVSEEIDALRTMGFGPMRYLVLPRAIAMMLVMPVLTLIGDLVGMIGGLVVGMTTLGLSAGGYVHETIRAVTAWDVFSGLVKSVVFALAITLLSCQQGFATTGGAEGVGKRTTASVVFILFTLIIIDAAFTMFFHYFKL